MQSAPRRIGRRCDGLFGDRFGPVVVRDATEQVTAKKQMLRQRNQVVEGRTFHTTTLQAFDRGRKIGESDSPARVTCGVDPHACRVFRPVSSAG